MAVKSKDEILEAVKNKIGEQTDDETIALIEDVTDTLNDLELKANGDGEDWKSKFEENDREWRKKYTDRFFSSEPDEKPNPPEQETEKPKTFDDLFTVKEN